MRWTERLARRIRVLFRKGAVERELDEELRAHVEMEADELARRGMEPERARREALRRFGGVERMKERVRDERGGRLLEDLVQDLRYGARTLRKSPGFSLSALLVLALGIGSATALFGVVDAVLLEPLPYPQPDRLVRVWPASPSRGMDRTAFSYPDARDWRERAGTLDGMAVYSTLPGDYVYLGGDAPVELATEWVGGDFFRVLGVAPAEGRALRPEDEEEQRMVAVLSWGAWQRLFAGDPSVVGRTVELDHRSFEVVGVMPDGFTYPEGTSVDLWVPMTVIPQDDIPTERRAVRFLSGLGRLAPGATIEAASSELSGIAQALEETYPDANAGISAATLEPLRDTVVGDVRTALWVALGAVGFILLLACANVANLLLARGTARTREVALRMSLGAPAGRVVRQLLTESLLLAASGGALGLAIAWAATTAMARWSAGLLPRAAGIGLDGTVVGVSILVTLAAATLAGMLPALRAADVSPADDLREGSRGNAAGLRGVRLRRGLVAAEVALAVLLLTGAGLLMRSLGALSRVDAGFETAGRIAMTLTISDEAHPDRGEWMGMYHQILERLRANPSVTSAAAIRYLPFRGSGEAIARARARPVRACPGEPAVRPALPGLGRRLRDARHPTSARPLLPGHGRPRRSVRRGGERGVPARVLPGARPPRGTLLRVRWHRRHAGGSRRGGGRRAPPRARRGPARERLHQQRPELAHPDVVRGRKPPETPSRWRARCAGSSTTSIPISRCPRSSRSPS